MNLDRVSNYSQQRLELERQLQDAQPLLDIGKIDARSKFFELGLRIEKLSGFILKTIGSPGDWRYGESSGEWTHTFSPNETHELPIRLRLATEYKKSGMLHRIYSTWHDNLDDDSTAQIPLSREYAYIPDMPSSTEMADLFDAGGIEPLGTAESLRNLGLIEESVLAAEAVKNPS